MGKYFTIEDANRAIILVRPIVQDILSKMSLAEELHGEVKKMQNQGGASETELLSKIRQAETFLNQVEYHMSELQSIGVLLKDLKLGLVDFPTLMESQPVYFCWMLGEENVQAWHETNKGFADRKPILEKVQN